MFEYRGLRRRAKGDTDPDGRPRVYICCHPDDYPQVNNRIANEILGIQKNAVIFDYEPSKGTPEGDEFLFDLLHMNLFVVAVTKNFIRNESSARDFELVFAVNNDIPILPLLQEDIPSRDFGAVCSGLQVLNRFALDRDPTSIPYKERLSSYLQSVLIGDSLSKRVKDAFDAQLFLSYRRSDRVLAQQVIRLIHNNDFLRNIAIWYDEFLEIGEDYRPAIAEALQESSAFVLIVTPQLLEEGNYVLSVERRLAAEANLPILPVEVMPTDHEAFMALFEHSGMPISVEDPEIIYQKLTEILRDKGINRRTGDPSRDYLIGLAYLMGINVEIDSIRALSLIESAAKEDYHEAIERLVTMYETGERVKKDLRVAIGWQEQYAKLLREEIREWPSLATRRKLIRILDLLGRLQLDAKKVPEALKAYLEQLEIAKGLAWETIATEDRRRLVNALLRVGGAKLELNDPNGANECYEDALVIVNQLAEETKTDGDARTVSLVRESRLIAKRSQADALIGIGDSYINNYNLNRSSKSLLEEKASRDSRFFLKEARKAYEGALSICELLVAEANTEEHRRLLTCALIGFGEVLLALRDASEALEVFERSLAIREKLAADSSTLRAWGDLAYACSQTGHARWNTGDTTGALDAFERALAIREELASKDDTPRARSELASAFTLVGNARWDTGDTSEALAAFEKAIAIRERLAGEVSSPESRIKLERVFVWTGDVRSETGDVRGALAAYEKALAICEELVGEVSTDDVRLELEKTLALVGDARSEVGDVLGATSAYERAFTICEELAGEVSSSGSLSKLEGALLLVGNALKKYGNVPCAIAAYETWLEIREKLIQITRVTYYSQEYYDVNDWLGRTYLTMGNVKQALPAIEQALYNPFYGPKGSEGYAHYRREFSVSLTKAGQECLRQGNNAMAADAFAKALKIRKDLAEESPSIDAMRDLAASHVRIGDAYREMGDSTKSLEAYQHASMLFREVAIASEDNSLKPMKNLAITLMRIGMLSLTEKAGRRSSLQEALGIWKRLLETTGESYYKQQVITVQRELAKLEDRL